MWFLCKTLLWKGSEQIIHSGEKSTMFYNNMWRSRSIKWYKMEMLKKSTSNWKLYFSTVLEWIFTVTFHHCTIPLNILHVFGIYFVHFPKIQPDIFGVFENVVSPVRRSHKVVRVWLLTDPPAACYLWRVQRDPIHSSQMYFTVSLKPNH